MVFETVEKQPCKQKTMLLEKWFTTKPKKETTNILYYLENRVVREPCKGRTVWSPLELLNIDHGQYFEA